MAQRTETSRKRGSGAPQLKGNSTGTRRSKAQQAASKTKDELRVEKRNYLILRLVASVVLVFFALFLVLSMLGTHAVFLDFLRSVTKGLLGYGYWLMPLTLMFMAWMLFFLHDEPIGWRITAAGLLTVVLSALLHTCICGITFQGGFPGIKALWNTGIENGSGGVVPGLISLAMQSLVSKGGTIPVLIVLAMILVFLIFRISAAKLIHRRAERHRERLEAIREEIPEPEPEQYDTKADLRVLATPVRPRSKQPQVTFRRKEKNFDLELGSGSKLQNIQRTFPEDHLDDDLIFLSNAEKQGRKEAGRSAESSLFDIPVGGSYTEEVQKLVHQEQSELGYEPLEPIWPQETSETLTEQMKPVREKSTPIPEDELSEAALEAMKDQTVSRDEARMAAAQVAMEIEAREDAEAQEKPVYQYPPMSMLAEAMEAREDNTEEMRINVRRLEETLSSFGVDSKIGNVVRGPAVTRYEMELKPGVKMSKITSLHEDIALSLGVTGVHVAAVPGKSSTIGIEVPNSIVTSVPIKEVLNSKEFKNHKSALAFAAGKDISGNYIIGDIAKMPHLLIAGTTGSGKSVCMNSIIVSLLYRDNPEQCRLIMIDPKVVELSIYNGIPHLLIPVVTDPKKAAGALQWAVTEMERRYRMFEDARVRDLAGYNKKVAGDPEADPMPRIVIIIDELADLMMAAAKEVETSIARLAAKARAAGMHLVIATQRPSADVITGVIKANIPSRIAFAVSSAMESNIIMGSRGAEKLVGKGDMFFAPQGTDKPRRVQGCFISDEEVESVAEFVKNSSAADYSQEILQEIEQNAAVAGKPEVDNAQTSMSDCNGDELLPDAVEVILDTKQASVSMLQRRLKLGYAHAARIVDEMEEKGIVGPFEGSKPRQLLITREQWETMIGVNPKAKAPQKDASVVEVDETEDPPFDEEV